MAATNLIAAYFKQISGCFSHKVLGLIMKSTSTWLPIRAGRGSGGVLQSAAYLVITMIAGGNHTTANWLKVGESMWLKSAAAKGFADNASPGRFLWFVSCADTRNEHITVLGQNQQIDKSS